MRTKNSKAEESSSSKPLKRRCRLLPQLLFLPYWQVATKTYGRPRITALDHAQVVAKVVAKVVVAAAAAIIVEVLVLIDVEVYQGNCIISRFKRY